jgi:hypothetical protein
MAHPIEGDESCWAARLKELPDSDPQYVGKFIRALEYRGNGQIESERFYQFELGALKRVNNWVFFQVPCIVAPNTNIIGGKRRRVRKTRRSRSPKTRRTRSARK